MKGSTKKAAAVAHHAAGSDKTGLPQVGGWYRRGDRPEPFHVTAFDEGAGEVDVEYLDGTLDEWPLSHWKEVRPERSEPPQDGSGPFDAAEVEPDPVDGAGIGALARIGPIEDAHDEAEQELLDRLAQDLEILRRRHARPRPSGEPRGKQGF